jgi:arylsulfatase A-like enzyme
MVAPARSSLSALGGTASVCEVRLLVAFAALLCSVGKAHADLKKVDKPNVIVILVDDLGYADLGVQGCQEFPTPHIDALASDGIRCTAGYVSSPVCGPTRAGLLTGRYQQRFGFEYNPSMGRKNGLAQTETTLGDLLTTAGYVTGAIGKWHLGKTPDFHPLECGFDEFFGFVGGGRSYFSRDVPIENPFVRRFTPDDPLVRGRTQVDDPEYLTDAFGEEAVSFIDRHKESPFFLYVAFNAVHMPLQATQRYLDRVPEIENNARRTYAAMMQSMDDAVGAINRKLQREQLEHKTLVFFLSDNGGHPIANAARNDPLRGQKGTIYEGGIRVPFLVKWTGSIPAGRTYPHPVISLDIFPTALAAAGVEIPNSLDLDGVDLLPHLNEADTRIPHKTLYWRYGLHRAIRHGKWKLATPANQPTTLYDLSVDIAESRDVSQRHPDVVKELTQLYDEWDSQMERPRWRSLFMKDAPGPLPQKKKQHSL